MKKILGIATLAIMAASSASAADFYASISGLYGKGGVKVKNSSTTLNTKPKGFDVAFGTYITPETRAELAVGYANGTKKIEGNKHKDEALSFMLNGYYDFNNESAFTPYLMGGLGYARAKYSNSVTKFKSKGGFQYQLGLGVDAKVADNVKLGVGYRFRHNLTKYKFAGIKASHKPAHLAIAQVRFEF